MAALVMGGINCEQHKIDATTTNKPDVVVWTNTDLLVMLVALSTPEIRVGINMFNSIQFNSIQKSLLFH